MTESFLYFLFFIAGLLIGTRVVSYVMQKKLKNRFIKIKGKFEVENAELSQKLKTAEKQLTSLRTAFQDSMKEIESLKNAVTTEKEYLSQAEDTNLRIPELERELKERNNEISRLIYDNKSLRAEVKKAEEKLAEKVNTPKEELEFLKELHKNFKKSFEDIILEIESLKEEIQISGKKENEINIKSIEELIDKKTEKFEKVYSSNNELKQKLVEIEKSLKRIKK